MIAEETLTIQIPKIYSEVFLHRITIIPIQNKFLNENFY